LVLKARPVPRAIKEIAARKDPKGHRETMEPPDRLVLKVQPARKATRETRGIRVRPAKRGLPAVTARQGRQEPRDRRATAATLVRPEKPGRKGLRARTVRFPARRDRPGQKVTRGTKAIPETLVLLEPIQPFPARKERRGRRETRAIKATLVRLVLRVHRDRVPTPGPSFG
jgi:hypothetical protein